MEFSSIIGIDVSKLTIDVHVLPTNQASQSENDEPGFKQLFKWLKKDCKLDLATSLFAFEYTGFYSFKLSTTLQGLGLNFVMIPGLELRRSLGISRAKTDPIDAERIADYTFLRRHKLTLTKLPEKDIMKMKRLLSLRDKLIRQRSGFKVTLSEARRAFDRKEDPTYYRVQEAMVKQLTSQIDKLEDELLLLVKKNPELQKQYELITSIKGIGMVTALTVIAFTHAFNKFPTWRKFACYSGIAPFPYQSGTSVKGRTKVSHLANKRMKALLGNITGSAIQHNTEMKLYYQRRTKKGKHKMSTQNVIRNKLLSRIFAVVLRGTPYVDTLKYAA
jgi:transposase